MSLSLAVTTSSRTVWDDVCIVGAAKSTGQGFVKFYIWSNRDSKYHIIHTCMYVCVCTYTHEWMRAACTHTPTDCLSQSYTTPPGPCCLPSDNYCKRRPPAKYGNSSGRRVGVMTISVWAVAERTDTTWSIHHNKSRPSITAVPASLQLCPVCAVLPLIYTWVCK